MPPYVRTSDIIVPIDRVLLFSLIIRLLISERFAPSIPPPTYTSCISLLCHRSSPFHSHSTNPSGSLVYSVRVFCALFFLFLFTVLSGERVYLLVADVLSFIGSHSNKCTQQFHLVIFWRVGHLLLVALSFMLVYPVVSKRLLWLLLRAAVRDSPTSLRAVRLYFLLHILLCPFVPSQLLLFAVCASRLSSIETKRKEKKRHASLCVSNYIHENPRKRKQDSQNKKDTPNHQQRHQPETMPKTNRKGDNKPKRKTKETSCAPKMNLCVGMGGTYIVAVVAQDLSS